MQVLIKLFYRPSKVPCFVKKIYCQPVLTIFIYVQTSFANLLLVYFIMVYASQFQLW